ncbi:MAG: hypothetical protein WC299_01735 [Kiritimatiellia bacterium]
MEKILRIIMSIMAVGIGIGACSTEASGRLSAGTAKADITPAAGTGVSLVGQPLKDRDRLFARVLVLKDANTSVAIVSLDLILFSSAKVVSEAKAKWKVDHVILCSTHTHAGMAPQGLIIKKGSKDWTRAGDPGEELDWAALSADPWYAATESKIVDAIGEAVKNMFPATVMAARGPYDGAYMAHNRRLVNTNGTVTAMWDNPKRLPTRPVDQTLGVIRVDDEAGKTRALLVNFACHAVASMGSGYLTRDYPGAMVDYVEQELGDKCMAMFVNGAEGDQDPYDMHAGTEHGFNIIRQCGISLGKAALNLSKSIKPRQDAKSQSLKAKESILKIKCRKSDKVTDVLVSTAVINGEVALVAVPGEPFVQHQIDLRAKSPLANTFLLGLAYSGAGTPFTVYIPTAQAVKEGGYGAAECSFLEPQAGEIIVEAGATAIKDLIVK